VTFFFSLFPVRPFIARLIDANYNVLFIRQVFLAKQNQRKTNRRYEQLLKTSVCAVNKGDLRILASEKIPINFGIYSKINPQ